MEDDDQTRREAPIPVPQIPDLAGKRGGNPRFPTPPESGIGKSPVSRFGRDRESLSRGRHAGDFPGGLVEARHSESVATASGRGSLCQWAFVVHSVR